MRWGVVGEMVKGWGFGGLGGWEEIVNLECHLYNLLSLIPFGRHFSSF